MSVPIALVRRLSASVLVVGLSVAAVEALDNVAGTPREIVILNAGAALYAADIAASIGEGIGRAREAIASGAARQKVDQFVAATRRIGG